MFKNIVSVAFFIVLSILIISCGSSEKKADSISTANLLPEKITGSDMVLSSKPKTFSGQTLYEHINGGAEIFHLYKFIDIATAYYKSGETEILADIYNFSHPDNAYGMYSLLRPPGIKPIDLGVEGFQSSLSIDFVKGKYLVRLTGYEENETSRNMMTALATELAKNISGTTSKPALFSKFPHKDVVPYFNKISAESFLGQPPLSFVYSVDYKVDDKYFTLFLAEDKNGAKYSGLKSIIDASENKVAPESLSGLNIEPIAFQNNYYGTIICGKKGTFLVGMVNYTENHKDFFNDWVASL